MAKDYRLTMSAEQSFNKDSQRNKIKEKAKYNHATSSAVDAVSELDRYDDFANTKIPVSAYANDGSCQYGIVYNRTIHGTSGNVLLDNQRTAAKEFLSNLRGFGLLADCVGSGKTFEACIILSELSARGKVQSILLVVPEQTLTTNWVDVLENKFGLGKGALYIAKDYDYTFKDEDTCVDIAKGDDGAMRPVQPMIVSTSDFATWSSHGDELSGLLFDIIIVDEAHNLSMEEGEYSKAMMLLSMLMTIKKKYNKTYCVLLSATPHSGNLDRMFRLWYFIRRRGGNYHDFEEKEDRHRTEDYIREKAFYTNTICRGATTVAEFIRVSKRYELEGADEKYIPVHRKVFMQYIYEHNGISENKFANMPENEKAHLRDEFLDDDANSAIRADVLAKIANSYHQSVMRSIMIRQPRQGSVGSKRIVQNFYFLPVQNIPTGYTFEYDGVNIAVDYAQLHTDKAITTVDMLGNAVSRSMLDYAKYITGYDTNRQEGKEDTLARQYSDMLFQHIFNIPHSSTHHFFTDKTVDSGKPHSALSDNAIFEKKHSHKYYWSRMEVAQKSQVDDRIVMTQVSTDSMEMAEKVFDAKYQQFVKIARDNNNERMVVFFDYDLSSSDVEYAQWYKLRDALIERDPDIASRVIPMSDGMTTAHCRQCESIYNDNEGAILLANSSLFTEGINLQSGHIVVNFQVTCDPLAMDQRLGRVDRLGQRKKVKVYSLASMNRLEGYSLAYFVKMGIIQNTNGDAIIIAGSNNKLMAIRCPSCGRVELISPEDYISYKNNGKLYCNAYASCRAENAKGIKMEEINIHEFKCDSCDKEIVRGEGDAGYQCMSVNNTSRGKYTNISETGNRKYHCSKLCIVNRCKRFKIGELQQCPIINSAVPLGSMMCKALCDKCHLAKSGACPEECRFGWNALDDISGCIGCKYSECTPKPHVLYFDQDWIADCPNCADGKLRKKEPRTFASFIKALYEFKADNGEGFCGRFEKEDMKTEDIRKVLENDNM